MQFGHVPLALSISTYDWSPRTVVFVGFMHMLPNFDVFPIRMGLAKKEFHCTVTHSFAFAAVVGGLCAWLLAPKWGILAFAAIVAHYFADIGSSVGLPLFYPFYKKRLTLHLFEDTGYWGWDMIKGYYAQFWPIVLESAVTLFLVYRLLVIYGVL